MTYIATVVLQVDEKVDGYRSDKSMIERFLKNTVKTGKVNENVFRGKVVLNVKGVKINVMNID